MDERNEELFTSSSESAYSEADDIESASESIIENNYEESQMGSASESHSQTAGSTSKNNYYYYDNDAGFKKAQKKTKDGHSGHSGAFGKKVVKAIALGLVFGLVAGTGFTGANYLLGKTAIGSSALIADQSTSKESKSSSKTVETTAVSNATTVNDVSELAENVMPAVVSVTNVSVTQYRTMFGTYSQDSSSCGTGFIFDQDDNYLYIATNYHVISNSNSITVAFCDDSSVNAEIAGADEDQDLAVLRVGISGIESSTLGQIKVAELGEDEDLKVGQSVIAIGNALGYGTSVTAGIISVVDRHITISDGSQTFDNTVIQTDAAINPGNSGGPLVDMNGKVIGIVNSKLASTSIEGVGYAIPISRAYDIITDLEDDLTTSDSGNDSDEIGAPGSDAYVGISGIDVTNSMSQEYNKPVGVYISSVASGSGAEAAGIEQGDVITEFDGKDITSMEEIQTILIDLHPGDKVSVTVAKASNNYLEEKITVVLGEKPTSN